MEVYGKTITGLGPPTTFYTNVNESAVLPNNPYSLMEFSFWKFLSWDGSLYILRGNRLSFLNTNLYLFR